jgi:hypothetical protein
MNDVLKIVIFALALVGLVTLIIHLHWLGAVGVLGVIINDIKPTSEAAERTIDRILALWDKWKANRKEVKEENSDE